MIVNDGVLLADMPIVLGEDVVSPDREAVADGVMLDVGTVGVVLALGDCVGEPEGSEEGLPLAEDVGDPERVEEGPPLAGEVDTTDGDEDVGELVGLVDGEVVGDVGLVGGLTTGMDLGGVVETGVVDVMLSRVVVGDEEGAFAARAVKVETGARVGTAGHIGDEPK